jgi:hypothetical protein
LLLVAVGAFARLGLLSSCSGGGGSADNAAPTSATTTVTVTATAGTLQQTAHLRLRLTRPLAIQHASSLLLLETFDQFGGVDRLGNEFEFIPSLVTPAQNI